MIARTYAAWLAALSLLTVAYHAFIFLLYWEAGAISGALASALATALLVPRLLVATFAGAISDRYGPPVVLAVAAHLGLLATILLVLAGFISGPTNATLVVAAIVTGTLDGILRPAAAAYPARAVQPEAVPQALAAKQTSNQLSQFAGPLLGGALVACGALGGLLALIVGWAAMAVAMLRLRGKCKPASAGMPPTNDAASGAWASPLEGFVTIYRRRSLHIIGLSVVALGAFALPAVTLLLPLMGRERSWTAQESGFAVGAFGAGFVLVAALVVTYPRVRLFGGTVFGVVIATLGLLGISLAPHAIWAALASALVGVGVGFFGTRSAVEIVAQTPSARLSAVQAAMIVLQALPLAIASSVVGPLADWLGASVVAGACAIALVASVGLGLICSMLGARGRAS